MQDISPLGWAAIIFILVVIVIMNVGLVAFLRYRPTARPMPKPSRNLPDLNRMVEVAKDPFGEQRRQIHELSNLVDRLKNHSQNQDDD